MRRFADRAEAGLRLAEELGRRFRGDARPQVVLGVPRGGVIVARAVADALDLPLDVVVVRKVGAPGRPELGVGAVGEDGVQVVNEELVAALGLDAEDLAPTVRAEQEETLRRVAAYLGGRPRAVLRGVRVLIVDDGLATGSTLLAAIEVARRRGAASVVVAVPVADPRAVALVAAHADDVIALRTPRRFTAVGETYRDFGQTSDEEVVDVLNALAL